MLDDTKATSNEFEEASYNFDVKAEEVAKAKGLIVVYPEPNQLQFDIDSEEAYINFRKKLKEFEFEVFAAVMRYEIEEHYSNSGAPHRHITLSFFTPDYTGEDTGDNEVIYEFEEYQRIALQAVLGSDPIREFLNCKRLFHGVKNPTRLFEKENSNA